MTRAGCHRWSARTDSNQRDIVARAKGAGFAVIELNRVGGGCPDLLVSDPVSQRTALVEIKMPGKAPSKKQIDWHRAWLQRSACEIAIISEFIELILFFRGKRR